MVCGSFSNLWKFCGAVAICCVARDAVISIV